jgi:hypothetical protein
MMQNRRNPRTNPSGKRDNTVSEEKLASTGHSRKAQMPESRINVEDMTPDKAKETTNPGTAQPDDRKAKGGAQQKSDNDQEKAHANGSAQCRVDTDLSGRGYMASQANGAEAENSNDWHGRREDKARTQNRAEDPKHLRQGNNQRVIHSKQDHVVNLPSNLIQSEDQFG